MKKLLITAFAGLFIAPVLSNAGEVSITGGIGSELCLSCKTKDDTNGTTTDTDRVNRQGFSVLTIAVEEDLGTGTTAYVSVTNKIDVTEADASGATNNSNWSLQDGRIGLKGDWGNVMLTSREPIFELTHIIDAFGAQNGDSGGTQDSLLLTGIAGGLYNFTHVMPDMISYQMAPMGNLNLELVYGWGAAEETGDGTEGTTSGTAYDMSIMQVGASYAMGNITLKGSYANHTEVDPNDGAGYGIGSGAADASGIVGALIYDMGNVKISVAINDLEMDMANSTTFTNTNYSGKTFERSGQSINIQYPVSTGLLTFHTSMVDDVKVDGTALANSGAKNWNVGYIHNLSASTYIFGAYVNKNLEAQYAGNTASAAETTETHMKVGMRINF